MKKDTYYADDNVIYCNKKVVAICKNWQEANMIVMCVNEHDQMVHLISQMSHHLENDLASQGE